MTLELRQFRAGPHDWRVVVGGDGPVMLFLHGAGASAESFRELMALLANRWTVVAPDLPGHGGTRLGSASRSGLAAMAEDVSAMVEATFGVPAVVVGHSAGGAIAAATDQIWPEAVRVLINPALAPFDGAAGWVFPKLARALSSAPFASRLVSQAFAKPSRIQGLLAETGSPVTDEAVTRYSALAADPAHIKGTLMMMAAWDVAPVRDRMARQDAPALFLLGTSDGTVAPDVARLIAGRMPNARVDELPGGHLLHEEAPSLVAERIAQFVDARAL